MTGPGTTSTDPLRPGSLEPAIDAVFGARAGLARRYADLLCGAGIARGLLGPHEAVRIWERHLFNCAAVADLLPTVSDARLVDLGSGAGLPGLVIALCRPELPIDLVEPLARRCTFLTEAVEQLGLREQVRVVRGRAEEPQVRVAVGGAAWVTARAVAPLDRLVRWALPLLRPGGALLAVKGERAQDEAAAAALTVSRLGGRLDGVQVRTAEGGEPARVVVVSVPERPRAERGRR